MVQTRRAVKITLCLMAFASSLIIEGCGQTSLMGSPPTQTPELSRAQVWITTSDLSERLTQHASLVLAPDTGISPLTITVDTSQRFQQMDGFGAAMTDTSAWLIWTKLTETQRTALMTNLFDPEHGIGLSFVRVPIGASDFVVNGPYSYDDMPIGQSDPGLAHFSIEHDLAYIVPTLKTARQLNPNIKFMANPWSPPGWMKTSDSMIGGSLPPSSLGPLAAYFIRFLQAYQAQGLPIYAITPQNEPGLGIGYPYMDFPAEQETTFVSEYLGPALAGADLRTKLWILDSNWDQSEYATSVLSNLSASPYVDGIAFHCYRGNPDAMSEIHAAYPNKEIFETECSTGIATISAIDLIIQSARNWAHTAVMWNVAEDTQQGPHIGYGCTGCTGTVTIDQSSGSVTYNREYYELGQASKFVLPGAYRVASNDLSSQGLANVAFINPNGSKVLIVHNTSAVDRTFQVDWHGKGFKYVLPAGAIATFVWN